MINESAPWCYDLGVATRRGPAPGKFCAAYDRLTDRLVGERSSFRDQLALASSASPGGAALMPSHFRYADDLAQINLSLDVASALRRAGCHERHLSSLRDQVNVCQNSENNHVLMWQLGPKALKLRRFP